MRGSLREFGVHLYQLRGRFGFSAAEVAHRIGVGVSSIFNWEAGTEMPPPKYLKRLAAVFQMTVQDLIGG